MKPEVHRIHSIGSKSLIVHGHGLSDTTQVLFARISPPSSGGGAPRSYVPAAKFKVESDSIIMVDVPVHDPALVDVIVVGPDGVSEQVPEDRYTFVKKPHKKKMRLPWIP